jgi:hypothetical protein
MRLLLILVILVAAGCVTEKPQPAVQPIPEPIKWNGVTQYDYKAGAPNDYTPKAPEPNSNSGYTNSTYPSLDSYFPEVYNPHHFDVGGGGGGSSYYYAPITPISPTPATFWTGSATVMVQ